MSRSYEEDFSRIRSLLESKSTGVDREGILQKVESEIDGLYNSTIDSIKNKNSEKSESEMDSCYADLDQCIELYKELLGKVPKESYKHKFNYKFHIKIAKSYSWKNAFGEAIEYYKEAEKGLLKLIEKPHSGISFKIDLMKLHRDLGYTYSKHSDSVKDWEEALKTLNEAEREALEILDKEVKNKAVVKHSLINIYLYKSYSLTKLKRYDSAVQHLLKALDHAEKMADKKHIHVANKNLAYIHGMMDEWEKALEYIKKVKATPKSERMKNYILKKLDSIVQDKIEEGVQYIKEEDLEKSLEIFENLSEMLPSGDSNKISIDRIIDILKIDILKDSLSKLPISNDTSSSSVTTDRRTECSDMETIYSDITKIIKELDEKSEHESVDDGAWVRERFFDDSESNPDEEADSEESGAGAGAGAGAGGFVEYISATFSDMDYGEDGSYADYDHTDSDDGVYDEKRQEKLKGFYEAIERNDIDYVIEHYSDDYLFIEDKIYLLANVMFLPEVTTEEFASFIDHSKIYLHEFKGTKMNMLHYVCMNSDSEKLKLFFDRLVSELGEEKVAELLHQTDFSDETPMEILVKYNSDHYGVISEVVTHFSKCFSKEDVIEVTQKLRSYIHTKGMWENEYALIKDIHDKFQIDYTTLLGDKYGELDQIFAFSQVLGECDVER